MIRLEKARDGVRGRVGEGRRRPEMRGMNGSIEQRYGSPDYPALDALLEDGARELFWALPSYERSGTDSRLWIRRTAIEEGKQDDLTLRDHG